MTKQVRWFGLLVGMLLALPAIAQDEPVEAPVDTAKDSLDFVDDAPTGDGADDKGSTESAGSEGGSGAELGAPQFELVYEGELIDEESQPVAGVFPLVFKLYAEEKAKKVLWSEAHHIAVSDGRYVVVLGRTRHLPELAAKQTLFLAVELDGHEMMRQELRATPASAASASTSLGGPLDYAERAGDANTLGGLAASDFAPATVELTLQRHMADTKVHGGGGAADAASPSVAGTTLSGQPWKSDYAGGSGGKVYTLNCPAGYVMTGIEGRSGAVIDSLRVICTKLE